MTYIGTSLVWVVWCVGPLGTAMRVRVLHAKLYAYALPGSTARQLFISSTLLDSSTARQLLDRPRQTSTKLDAPAHGVSLDRLDKARQGSTGKASTTGSTAPRRSLDSSTARQPGLKPRCSPALSLHTSGLEASPERAAAGCLVVARVLFALRCSLTVVS